MGSGEVDITISEGSPSSQVSTDTNRHNLTHLAKRIEKLRVRNTRIQISDVKRRRTELSARCNRTNRRNRAVLSLTLSHFLLFFWFLKLFSSFLGVLFLCALLSPLVYYRAIKIERKETKAIREKQLMRKEIKRSRGNSSLWVFMN